MPELPEVEVYRSYLAYRVLHKKIKDVTIKSPEVIAGSKKAIYGLKGKKFSDTDRHGKYCFLKTSNNKFLVLHFGMTGDVKYYKNEAPEHSALIFEFTGKHKFSYTNVRKFGKIYLKKNKKEFIKNKKLGPDAESIKEKEFIKIIKSKKGMIKTSLMDQQAIAGIGNIYSDEILYQTNIKPTTTIKKLNEKQIKKMYTAMKRIFKTAIKHNTDYSKMPTRYLVGRREKGADCGICNGKIKTKKIGGRTAYYCPKHQK